MSYAKLWEVLVPVAKHPNAKPFPKEFHQAWDTKIATITKGLTILSTTKGRWISATGKLYREKMIPVRISCTRKQLDKILDITRQHYMQQVVMAYKISDEVIMRAA